MIYRLFVILAVFSAACAQMLLKQGARGQYSSFWRQYINPWVIGGYGIMFLAMAVNVYCLSKGVQVKELSIFESLSYLFVPVLSFLVFGERLTWRKMMAVGVIVIGIIVFFI